MIETFLMVLPLFHVREHRETCDVLSPACPGTLPRTGSPNAISKYRNA